MNKLITFSLWGNDPKYCVGAIRNAELASKVYPGWTCRFYIPKMNFGGKKEWSTDCFSSSVVMLQAMDNVEVVVVDEPPDWRGMFWRFRPASEDDVDVFISRDCDSRLGEREAMAVQEWLDGPKLVHSIGDHPYHFNPSHALMGGMFGMKKHACPQMNELIKQFCSQYPDAWQCDQDFLKDHVWPIVYCKVMAHSDLHPGCNPFRTQRQGLEFVGKIFLADETTVKEHEDILAARL